jgi:hypothetical protein
VTPLPSQGSSRTPGSAIEAVVDGGGVLGTIFRITASDVELNGLEIRNGTGDLVASLAGTPLSNVAVRSCIIHDATGDEGIQLRDIDGAVIECNYVYNTAGDGINLCCGSTDGQIRHNELRDINSPDAAIYVYESTNTTIFGNLIDHTSSNEGIKLGAKAGSDAANPGGSIVGNNTRNTRQDGIAVYMSDTVVECNEVTGSQSENGGIYLAFAVSNVIVRHNYVHDNMFNVGKWGDPAGIMVGTAPNAGTITVVDNHLSGNVPNGVTNKAAGLLVAENNWWGAVDGPAGAGPGSGDPVSVNVDYDPWRITPPPECPPTLNCPTGPVPAMPTTWGRIKSFYR